MHKFSTIQGTSVLRRNCRLEVACTVVGQLPPRPAAIKYSLTGDVPERRCLFDAGYFSLLKSVEELLFCKGALDGRPCCESITKFRTVTNRNVQCFEEDDINRALTKSANLNLLGLAAKQVFSIYNIEIDSDEHSIT